jgi:hypothetical protein
MKIRAVIMRGGTSKAVFFHEADLPADQHERDALILGTFGSPDPYRRQLDGLGGATSSTSKVAVIGDGSAHGVDVTYEFGQVSIDRPLVDRRGNCGNISSAVGPFAVDEGLVEVVEPVTQVRFLNTNTGKVIVAHVPVRDGRFDPRGTFALPGVPTTGAEIRLDYLDPGGSVTGALLPTGNVTDEVDVPGVGPVEISIVDAANPLVFVRWDALGLSGTELPEDIDSSPELLARIEGVRAAAAVIAGITASAAEATANVPSVPKLAFVGSPRDYVRLDGEGVSANSTTLRAAMMSMGRLHPSFALTGGICTAVASAIPGTIPAEATVGLAGQPGICHIGHPSGVLSLEAHPVLTEGAWAVDKVSAFRTARRLFEGAAYAPDSIDDL